MLFCIIQKARHKNMNKSSTSFSYELLKKASVYHDEEIIIIDRIKNIPTSNLPTIKTESFIALLCLNGNSSLLVNNNAYKVNQNDLLICSPYTIIKPKTASSYFECIGLSLSEEYIKQIMLISSDSWKFKEFIENNPILPLNEEKCIVFQQYYDLLRSKLTGTPIRHQKELTNALLQAFIYEFHDSLEPFINLNTPSQVFNSANNLFNAFVDLLSSSYPKKRSVNYYAEKLFVSPKYLSSICKEKCGEPASKLIKDYVTRDIKYLLKCPDKSIKEIANELEFSNLSFFGKYVKNQLGISPKQFREQLLQKNNKPDMI